MFSPSETDRKLPKEETKNMSVEMTDPNVDTKTANLPANIGRLTKWRQAYRAWQYERDFVAVVASLARLSDRRLELIGMKRENLIYHVDRMIDAAEAERQTVAEIIDILEGKEPVAQKPQSRPVETAEIKRFG